MKKAMLAIGLVMVMLFGVSYVYAQEQGDPLGHGWGARREILGSIEET